MGWHADREEWLERFERRSFGVLTRQEAWAIAVLSGAWPQDYDNETEADWLQKVHEARPLARAALERVAPVVDEPDQSRRNLLEERAALMRRLATVEAWLGDQSCREMP